MLTGTMKYQTPYSQELRAKVYELVEGGYSVTKACQLYGMPRKTYYKWLELDHDPKETTPTAKEDRTDGLV